jgi:hypothetical protein
MLRSCCFANCVSVWASFESACMHVGRYGAVMQLETYNDIFNFSDRIFWIMEIKIVVSTLSFDLCLSFSRSISFLS